MRAVEGVEVRTEGVKSEKGNFDSLKRACLEM